MDFSVETAGPLGRKLRIRVAAEDVQGQVEKRLRKLCKSVRLDGFRPGKAPLQVVEQRFGQKVFSEVASDLMQSNYTEVLHKELLKPAGYPDFGEIRAEPGQDLEFTASIEVYPEFEVAAMDRAAIEKPLAGVTEADVDNMVERVRKNHAEWKPVSRPARDGDRLTVDFNRAGESGAGHTGEGAGEEDASPGGSARDASLVLGSPDIPADLDEQLRGVCAGESRNVRVQTGDGGGEVGHEVAVQSVEEPILPELDEAFFKACGVGEGGLDGLRGTLREGMESELRARLAKLLKQRVMDALLEHNEFDVPGVMVEQEIETMRKDAMRRFQMKEKDGDRLPAELFRDEARRRVRLGLLLHRYAEQHDLKADRASFEARLDELAASYEDPESVKNYYRSNERMRLAVEALALEDQVVAQVLESAQIEEKSCTFDEIVHSGSGPEKTNHATN